MVGIVEAGVHGVLLPVLDVDGVVGPGDETLQLVEVEQAQQVELYDVVDAAAEGQHLLVYLLVELVVGDEVNVLDLVLVGDQYVLAARLELDRLRLAELCRVEREVEIEVLHVALVVFEVEQVLINFRVERGQVVDVEPRVVVLAQALLEKEAGKLDVRQQLALYGLGQHAAQEVVVRVVVGYEHGYVRIGIEEAVAGEHKEATVGVEAGLEQREHELAEDAAAVDAHLVEAEHADHLDLDAARLERRRVLRRHVLVRVLVQVLASNAHFQRRHAVEAIQVAADEILQNLQQEHDLRLYL